MKIPQFRLFGFRKPREIVCQTLGKLELEVMKEMWRCDEVSVVNVQKALDDRVAYTTIMTTLDRLYKKGLLERRKSGRAFLYSARVTHREFEQGVAEDVIDGLLARDSEGVEPLLACIVETVSERDRELLDTLYRLVQEKRRELQRQERH
jgi:predicted transcriptional regulator